MLPDGFEWHDRDEPRLLYRGHVIAVTARLPDGWRIDKNPNRITRRSVFVADEAAVRAHLEAWARRWETRLRQEYGR